MNLIPKWDNKRWLKRYSMAKSLQERNLLNKEVFENTVDIVNQKMYHSFSGKVVSLDISDRISSGSSLYDTEIMISRIIGPTKEPLISVVQMDCLECAHTIFEEYGEVCVLNNASSRYPGGSVIYGPGAQEEYLCKCSNYYQGLFKFGISDKIYGQYVSGMSAVRYPLDENFGGCYVPNVTVFRDSLEYGYRLIDIPWSINIIAVPAIPNPKLRCIPHNDMFLSDIDISISLDKIRTIFKIAILQKQQNLVLTAWGCGAYGNPPKDIATLFRQVLIEEEYQMYFDNIVFAIARASNSKENNINFEMFSKVFNRH